MEHVSCFRLYHLSKSHLPLVSLSHITKIMRRCNTNAAILRSYSLVCLVFLLPVPETQDLFTMSTVIITLFLWLIKSFLFLPGMSPVSSEGEISLFTDMGPSGTHLQKVNLPQYDDNHKLYASLLLLHVFYHVKSVLLCSTFLL